MRGRCAKYPTHAAEYFQNVFQYYIVLYCIVLLPLLPLSVPEALASGSQFTPPQTVYKQYKTRSQYYRWAYIVTRQ